jgi:hypothetical protein
VFTTQQVTLDCLSAEAGHKGTRDLFLVGLEALDLLRAVFLGTAPSERYTALNLTSLSALIVCYSHNNLPGSRGISFSNKLARV